MEWDLSSIPNAKQYDLSSIPDAKERPEVSALPNILSATQENPQLKERMADSIGYAQKLNILPSTAYRNHDEISQRVPSDFSFVDLVKREISDFADRQIGMNEAASFAITAFPGFIGSGFDFLANIIAGNSVDDSIKSMEDLASRIVYHPKTTKGQEYVETIMMPFEGWRLIGEQAGDYVYEKTKSPFLATVVRTGLESVPYTTALTARGMGLAAKTVRSSNWFRELTIKERGLVKLSLDDMIDKGYSEGEILRRWDNPEWREQALARRMVPEDATKMDTAPAEAVKPTEQPVVAKEPAKPIAEVGKTEEVADPFPTSVVKDTLYHGTNLKFGELSVGKDGGIHIGQKNQAEMRGAGKDTRIIPIKINVNKLRRSKDIGGSWKKEIESAKKSGYDGIVYLNRYEGMTTERVLENRDVDLDSLSDKQFLKRIPEAKDSYIVFSKEQISKIEPVQEKKPVKKVEQPPIPTEEPVSEYEIGELNKVDEQITAQASRQAEINVYKKLEKGKAKDEREIEKMAEADIKDIPVYRAMAEIKRRGGLNLKKISYQHSAEDRAQLTKKYPGLISKTGKEALDTIAEEIGYTDDNTLMDEMLAAPTKAAAKQKYIDDFYANYYGDMIEAGEDILPMLQAEESKLLKEATKKYKIKPAKGLKKFIREDTGQVKVKEIIEVKPGEILEYAMKEAQKAAGVAFRAGDKEGVAKAKAKYREAVEKKKFREDAKNYIKKLAKQISKEPGASIDFFYREAIENLQAGIDPSFRAKKTLKSRERTREFLSRYPESAEDMPTKLLKKLDKTSLNELTVGELEEISEKIDYLREVGKLKRGLKLKAATRQHDKNVEKIVAGITNNEPIDITKEPVVFSTTKEGKIDKIRKTSRAISLRPSRIFDKLDGAKAVFGDITHKLFYDDVNVAVDKELRKQDERFDGGTAKRENLGITLEDLSKTRKIGGVDYRVDEMIGVYCAAKNPLSQLAIMYGNNISEEIIPKIIDGLTTQEKAWGDYIISDYEANFVRLRESVIETRNEDIGHQENYTPMRRVGIDYKTSSQEIMDEVLMKNHFKKGFAESGFRIDRKSIPPEFQKPINLNVTGVWFDQVYKQEHYIHFAKLAKELNRIVDDKNFSTAVDQTFGKEYHTAIRHYVDRIANPNIYKAFSGIEKASRALRQNMVMAYLSGNIVTIGKQLPSVFFYLRDATPRHLFGAMAEFITDPMKMIDFVKSKDPQLKHRMIEREMEELKSLQRDAYDSIIKKVGKIGMKGIYTMDRVATTIGWKGVYDRALVEGKSEAEAIRLAQNATLRTQPAAHAKDIAELYATNEFLNWFTQFTNQLNQIYNIVTYDIPADIKGENYYNALMSSVGMALGALAIWVMSHRRLPETEEDVVDAFKEQTINAIPLFSKAIMAGTSGWKGSTIPVMKSGESLGVLMSDTTSRAKKRAMIEAICVTAGIPYTGPRRLYKAMSKQDARELIGGKPRD